MNGDENRKRGKELRWVGFQSFLTGIVIIFGVGCICFIFSDENGGLQPHSYLSGRGLGILLIGGVWGLWLVARGVIYLIRARSGDEHYAKGVEDVIEILESKHEEMMRKKMGNGSMRNVFVLLGWIFLFLAMVGTIGIGYLFWTRP
jgi:hypothetical protein